MRQMLSLEVKQGGLAEFAFIESLLNRLEANERVAIGRSFVTLSYAQSLDGSLSIEPSGSCALSSARSLKLTHFLRSRHDALLVGINTIIVDDPQLNVRHCHGENPQAVVLDTSLRFPPGARLLKAPSKPPIIVTTEAAPADKIRVLTNRGARILVTHKNACGMVDLAATLRLLQSQGLRSIMVEGGGVVINHFLQERLVDYCVITVTPKIIGGFKAVRELRQSHDQEPLAIADCQYHVLGTDMIVYGSLCGT